MVKKIILLILAFYILTLLQTSFLVYFNIWGITLNFVLIAVILINLLPERSEGLRRGRSSLRLPEPQRRQRGKPSFLPQLKLRWVKKRIYPLRLSSSWQQKLSSSVVGGFYLDIFSLSDPGGFFGFYTLILLGFSLFLKIILEKYVRFPVGGKI